MWKASQGMLSSNPSTRKADTSQFLEFTGSRSNQICEVKVQGESVSQKIIWRTIAQDIWHQPQTSISKLTYTQAHEYPCTKHATQVRERDLNLGIWKEFPALQCVLYKETLTFVDVWVSSPVLRSPQIPLLWWSNSEKHQAHTVVIRSWISFPWHIRPVTFHISKEEQALPTFIISWSTAVPTNGSASQLFYLLDSLLLMLTLLLFML